MAALPSSWKGGLFIFFVHSTNSAIVSFHGGSSSSIDDGGSSSSTDDGESSSSRRLVCVKGLQALEEEERRLVSSNTKEFVSERSCQQGRATLIQAVTSSIPVYTMQTVKLPGSICEDLD
ncbi:unnamed protein product [Prunus armeniaca]